MRLKFILIGIGAALLALVAGAFAVLMTTDFNDYRDLVQERIKAATGRDLVIAGDIDAKFSLSPRLSAKQVSFRNAAWSDIRRWRASATSRRRSRCCAAGRRDSRQGGRAAWRPGGDRDRQGWRRQLGTGSRAAAGADVRGLRHHSQRPAQGRSFEHRRCDAAAPRRRSRRAAHPRDQALHRRGCTRLRHQGRDQGRVERAAAGTRRHGRRAAAVHRGAAAAQSPGQVGRGRAHPARPDRRSHQILRPVVGGDQRGAVARGAGRSVRHHAAELRALHARYPRRWWRRQVHLC